MDTHQFIIVNKAMNQQLRNELSKILLRTSTSNTVVFTATLVQAELDQERQDGAEETRCFELTHIEIFPDNGAFFYNGQDQSTHDGVAVLFDGETAHITVKS